MTPIRFIHTSDIHLDTSFSGAGFPSVADICVSLREQAAEIRINNKRQIVKSRFIFPLLLAATEPARFWRFLNAPNETGNLLLKHF